MTTATAVRSLTAGPELVEVVGGRTRRKGLWARLPDRCGD